MKKYLVATALIVSFAAPAFAEEIYVAFDPASHKCTMMHSQPTAPMKSMGSFKSEAEAKAALTRQRLHRSSAPVTQARAFSFSTFH